VSSGAMSPPDANQDSEKKQETVTHEEENVDRDVTFQKKRGQKGWQ